MIETAVVTDQPASMEDSKQAPQNENVLPDHRHNRWMQWRFFQYSSKPNLDHEISIGQDPASPDSLGNSQTQDKKPSYECRRWKRNRCNKADLKPTEGEAALTQLGNEDSKEAYPELWKYRQDWHCQWQRFHQKMCSKQRYLFAEFDFL